MLTLLALAFGAAAYGQDGKVVEPFNGKDLSGWKVHGKPAESKWQVGTAVMDESNPTRLKYMPLAPNVKPELVNAIPVKEHSLDFYSEQKFGDCRVEVEFLIPKGSNSGVYLMGEYEVQILDTYGKTGKLGPGDMGGIYQNAAPRVNACKKPGEWQKYVIDFQAPRFDAAGKKTANARFLKVVLNDQVIHEDIEMTKGVTPGGITGREAATGPLMFQGNHGPVTFRNIRITLK
jgi:hypothetical protein